MAMTLREQYAEDTRFMSQLPKSEQKRLRAHVRYMLKKDGVYTKERLECALSNRICYFF